MGDCSISLVVLVQTQSCFQYLLSAPTCLFWGSMKVLVCSEYYDTEY